MVLMLGSVVLCGQGNSTTFTRISSVGEPNNLGLALPNPSQAYEQRNKSVADTAKHELTEAQCRIAIKEASGTSRWGIAILIAGGGIALLGSAIDVPSASGINTFMARLERSLVVAMGVVVAGIGTSTMIYGAVQEAHYTTLLKKFPAKITLSPRITRDFNHNSVGFSMAIRF